MSKAPANLNLEIDNLVFEGLSGHDARQAAAAFETTMTGLLSDRGLPKSWQSGVGIDLDLSGFDGAIDPKQWIADQKLDGSLQPTAGQKSYPNDYHIYGVKWTKDKIIFMLDGKPWGPGLDLTDKKKFGGRNIYNDYPFYLILNQAIGGNYFGVWGPGNPGPDKKGTNELYDFSIFPQQMQIDWVRVYQKT